MSAPAPLTPSKGPNPPKRNSTSFTVSAPSSEGSDDDTDSSPRTGTGTGRATPDPDTDRDDHNPAHGTTSTLDTNLPKQPSKTLDVTDTPTISETATNLRKTLSRQSLTNLDLNKVRKGVRQNVWRGKDEAPRRPTNLDQLLVNASSAGFRSFLLAYGIRAGVNLVLAVFTIARSKKPKLVTLRKALIGLDAIRFGAMFGSFTFLWKWMIHGLRIFNPGSRGRGKTQRWHAAVAGAVAGLAVFLEKRGRRITFAQQLFVRGLQAAYNMGKGRGMPTIPHGDVLLFGLACGQIMYAWLEAPESLPGGYRRWITNAAKVWPNSLPADLSLHRTGVFNDVGLINDTIERANPSPGNLAKLRQLAQMTNHGYKGPHAPCELVHPWTDSCIDLQFQKWQAVFRWMFPVYAALHFIPPILLRRKNFVKDPTAMLTKSSVGTLRSCSFLASFVVIFHMSICAQRSGFRTWGEKFPKILLHKYWYWVMGFTTCASMFIEEKKRRKELTMYVLPKALESIWSIARSRSWVPFVPGGEVLLTSIGTSMVMSAYHHEPKALSGLVRSILWQFVGAS